MKNRKIDFLTPVTDSDPRKKEWIVYDYDEDTGVGTTSAIRYLYTTITGHHKVAVGRSYLVPTDSFNKGIGRSKALKRLRSHFIQANEGERFCDYIVTTYYSGDITNAVWPEGTVLFETGIADNILRSTEMNVYNTIIKPRYDRAIASEPTQVTFNTLIPAPEMVESEAVTDENELKIDAQAPSEWTHVMN